MAWLFDGESLVVLVTIKMNGLGTQIFLLTTVCNLTSSLLLFQINNEALHIFCVKIIFQLRICIPLGNSDITRFKSYDEKRK